MEASETTLQTNRLWLRPMTPATITDLFRSQSEADFRKLFATNEKDYEKYRNMVEQGMETDRLSLLVFLLIEKESGRTIGQCGYHTWNRLHDRAEVFYGLSNDADKRKGYMKEALKAVLEYGFGEMNLNRIEAFVADYNEPSVRLLRHSGFRKEGTARGHYLVDGVYEDSDFYALLATDER